MVDCKANATLLMIFLIYRWDFRTSEIVLLLLQFTAPCVRHQVIHRIPDSRCTEEPL